MLVLQEAGSVAIDTRTSLEFHKWPFPAAHPETTLMQQTARSSGGELGPAELLQLLRRHAANPWVEEEKCCFF